MSCARDVITVCFGTSAFAATFVQLLSVGNLGGRFGWSALSDKIGRKTTFALFTCVGAPLCLSLPYIISFGTNEIGNVNNTSLMMFYGSTMLIISFFGSAYAVMPPYEAELFGTKNVGSIHGRMMLATAIGGIIGPTIFSRTYEYKLNNEILNLVNNYCDPILFKNKYGVGTENISNLINANAIKISDLLQICPANTMDPTPYLYDPAFQLMGGVLIIGGLSNFAIKSVDKKYFTRI